jgi:peptidoglycan hydrolase-like protein with peptidoglycan-binding domain
MGQRLSQDEVRQVQQKLADMGYDTGTPDGIMGPKTRGAVKKFQQDKSLQASGRLDQKTLDALGVSAPGSTTSGTRGSQGEEGGSMGGEGSKGSQGSEGSMGSPGGGSHGGGSEPESGGGGYGTPRGGAPGD